VLDAPVWVRCRGATPRHPGRLGANGGPGHPAGLAVGPPLPDLNRLWYSGHRHSALVVFAFSQMITAAEIHPAARIGEGLTVHHMRGTTIAAHIVIGCNCTTCHQVSIGIRDLREAGDPTSSPTIGDDVVLYVGAKIFGGVTIGDGAGSARTRGRSRMYRRARWWRRRGQWCWVGCRRRRGLAGFEGRAADP
jgi:hypothetical protein